jgi:hypothetical protein
MDLNQINGAITNQRNKIQTICAKLERAQSARDLTMVATLRGDLEGAQRALLRLDQIRRQETPCDAASNTVSRGSIFFGSNH